MVTEDISIKGFEGLNLLVGKNMILAFSIQGIQGFLYIYRKGYIAFT